MILIMMMTMIIIIISSIIPNVSVAIIAMPVMAFMLTVIISMFINIIVVSTTIDCYLILLFYGPLTISTNHCCSYYDSSLL